MSAKKKSAVTVLFSIFLVLSGAQFATQGLSNLYNDLFFYTIFPRYSMVLVCAAIAWIAGKDSFSGRDIIFIKILFAAFAAADMAMVIISITDNGTAGLIGRNMAWIFYTPTIILLALSTYDFTGFRKISDSR